MEGLPPPGGLGALLWLLSGFFGLLDGRISLSASGAQLLRLCSAAVFSLGLQRGLYLIRGLARFDAAAAEWLFNSSRFLSGGCASFALES